MNIAYGFHDDSPAKVDALIRKSTELTEIDSNRPATEAARRQRAEFLMEQSEQLLRWRVYDEAERLADDAIGLRDDLRSVRRQSAGPAGSDRRGTQETARARRSPGGGIAGWPGDGGGRRGHAVGRSQPGRSEETSVGTDEAGACGLGGAAARSGRALARQAEALQVPSAAFGPQEDRPGLVILEVAKLRARDQGVVRAGGLAIDVGRNIRSDQSIYDDQHDIDAQRAGCRGGQHAGSGGTGVRVKNRDCRRRVPAAGETPCRCSDRANRHCGSQHRSRPCNYSARLMPCVINSTPRTAQRLQDHLQLLSAAARGRAGGPRRRSIVRRKNNS